MNIGRLRERVIIQQIEADSPPVDEYGTPQQGWGEVATVWASVEPMSAREFIAAQAQQGETLWKITIRYLDGLTAAMRVLSGGRTFAITGLLDQQGRHRALVLMCRELTQ